MSDPLFLLKKEIFRLLSSEIWVMIPVWMDKNGKNQGIVPEEMEKEQKALSWKHW